jgi:mannose-6-phosphate isomerase
VVERFGTEFPLLIKYIDAQQDLSVQVHPNDELAMRRHQCPGKTEMWYIMHSEDGYLITGFKEGTQKMQYLESMQSKSIHEILDKKPVRAGDSFYIPAGTVHAIGKGVLLAEIQQTSDITYRIYDYDRIGSDGKQRELHQQEALDAINFGHRIEMLKKDTDDMLIRSPYFSVKLRSFSSHQHIGFESMDSFKIWMLLDGDMRISSDNHHIQMDSGETVLIPAELNEVELEITKHCQILETFIQVE